MPESAETTKGLGAHEDVQLGHLSRARLAQVPTPLEEAPRLSAAIGGPRILVKRDDQTALRTVWEASDQTMPAGPATEVENLETPDRHLLLAEPRKP